MLPSMAVVDLSRFFFAFTALFHFLFVPITLGVTWLLVIMEAAYLISGKVVFRDMTKFWGKLLAINFAIGVISGLTMEFEFGMNWAYFSRIIGGSFGPVLAIEGITAFMLEATMFGLFYFTWDKVSKSTHFLITLFMAIGASLSIVNILAANSWMQNPTFTSFNFRDMSLDLSSILGLYTNPLAQIRISHVAFGAFIVSAFFVMGISAFHILKNKDVGFAKRSFAVAVPFGLICAVMVFFYGDQNGLQVSRYEPAKMAAIEGQWTTQKAPAAWDMVAFPNQQARRNEYFTIKIPYLLSIIATHSLTGTVQGIDSIVKGNVDRIRNGAKAYTALIELRKGNRTPQVLAEFNRYKKDLGFGLLLLRYTKNPATATPAMIQKAAYDTIPQVSTAFWMFRVMIGIWGWLVLLLVLGFYYVLRDSLHKHRLYLRAMVYSIPLPFIAAEAGWILAEVGRQPWAVHNFLPTFLGTSSLHFSTLLASLILFFVFYGTLFSVELYLMFKFARKGPSCLHTGRYEGEKS